MRIMGVDPGSVITGYGIIDDRPQELCIVEAGIIKMKAKDCLENRIQQVYCNLDQVIKTHKPEILVLEKLYTHHQYRTTASVLGHVRGAVCLLCAERKVLLAENSVKRIRKAITGRGSATKKQTQKMVAYLLRIPEQQLTPDAADALALALGHVHLRDHKR